MCRIILCKPQREEDKLIDHEEERRQTHPDITNMISPVLTHISLKFYYRKYMLKKKSVMDYPAGILGQMWAFLAHLI